MKLTLKIKAVRKIRRTVKKAVTLLLVGVVLQVLADISTSFQLFDLIRDEP